MNASLKKRGTSIGGGGGGGGDYEKIKRRSKCKGEGGRKGEEEDRKFKIQQSASLSIVRLLHPKTGLHLLLFPPAQTIPYGPFLRLPSFRHMLHPFVLIFRSVFSICHKQAHAHAGTRKCHPHSLFSASPPRLRGSVFFLSLSL